MVRTTFKKALVVAPLMDITGRVSSSGGCLGTKLPPPLPKWDKREREKEKGEKARKEKEGGMDRKKGQI